MPEGVVQHPKNKNKGEKINSGDPEAWTSGRKIVRVRADPEVMHAYTERHVSGNLPSQSKFPVQSQVCKEDHLRKHKKDDALHKTTLHLSGKSDELTART